MGHENVVDEATDRHRKLRPESDLVDRVRGELPEQEYPCQQQAEQQASEQRASEQDAERQQAQENEAEAGPSFRKCGEELLQPALLGRRRRTSQETTFFQLGINP